MPREERVKRLEQTIKELLALLEDKDERPEVILSRESYLEFYKKELEDEIRN